MMDVPQRSSRVLLLPGWQNSGPAHWQSRWQTLHGHGRVEQDDWDWPRRGDWMARLDEVLLATPEPVALVAHSLGTQLVAAWAAHSRHTQRVHAAMLVAPPDTERPDMPPNLFNWRPIARRRLPFPSLAVLSSDDPFCAVDRGRAMAADWGSEVVEIGARGHINGESGLGDWPAGIALMERLLVTTRR
jgi:predicted alpha/beta hydrolase family esterase